ncbi:hypothetical protein BDY19DRAFT_909143 [Irpex rosettiformis]|uniref:Uncharacterized protein n=1 Tax=Irpex rosettiformis TaxID=378272 RepID=A0ACB8TTJ8_9APHY|nr:hypothetical protein BDY19DRAFT_909143 [Irpex rosettiformis]
MHPRQHAVPGTRNITEVANSIQFTRVGDNFIPIQNIPNDSLTNGHAVDALAEVVTIAISFSLKKDDALPGPAANVDEQACEKASYNSGSNAIDEDLNEVCHDIGRAIPLSVEMSPQDGLIRQGGDVVVSLTVPKEYRDRICTKITTVSAEPLQDDAQVGTVFSEPQPDLTGHLQTTSHTASGDAPSRQTFKVFHRAPKRGHRWSF